MTRADEFSTNVPPFQCNTNTLRPYNEVLSSYGPRADPDNRTRVRHGALLLSLQIPPEVHLLRQPNRFMTLHVQQ